MNVRELQIADWVRLVADGDNEILQVTYVREDGVGFKKYAVYFDEIEAIPLTAEILEVNGWKKRSYDHALYLHDDILSIDLGESYSQFGYSHMCGVGTDCVETEYCSEIDFVGTLYVHQLQHALRLCGMNELADNFKIK